MYACAAAAAAGSADVYLENTFGHVRLSLANNVIDCPILPSLFLYFILTNGWTTVCSI